MTGCPFNGIFGGIFTIAVNLFFFTVLMEVGPTTILMSSKQEEGLKRMVSAYGRWVGRE